MSKRKHVSSSSQKAPKGAQNQPERGERGERGEMGEKSECPVCFEELSHTGSRDGLQSSHFPCGHLFCKRCFDRVELCPLCRTSKCGTSAREQRERREQAQEDEIPEFVRRFIGIISREGASVGRRRQRRPAQIVRYQGGDGGNPANFTMSMFNISNPQQIIEAAFSAAGSNPPPSFLARLPTMHGIPEMEPPEEVRINNFN